MPTTELFSRLPAFVVKVVQQLENDQDSQEVWLIGSRASNKEHATSDWDLLLMSFREPQPVSRRDECVDVLHVGPSGKVLLEGELMHMVLDFNKFFWTPVSNIEANYIGMKFPSILEGVVRDSSEPAVVCVQEKGHLLWCRSMARY